MSEPVKPGSIAATIVADEERLHARVQARVALGQDDSSSRSSPELHADFDRDLVALRDAIAEARAEDLPPLVEQMTRVAAIRARLGGSRSLPIDVASPYFAHMSLREEERSRDVLIGKRGFIDRQANVQIVDWRNAPISQIYYRYEEGDDYDDSIEGRSFRGVLEVRRNVSIAAGRLRRIGSPQGTFLRDARGVWHEAIGDAAPVLQGGQGKAARAPRPAPPPPGRRRLLGVHHGEVHRADKHLPEIAALIDREQFDLITQPSSGVVLIQGGAGSGKTTVALHRIAYLCFADPGRFKPDRVLFVVPSRALARYVEGVLPALGVRGVPVLTYVGWAKNARLRMLRGTSGKYNSATPDSVSRLKKHPRMLALLDAWVADQAVAAERQLAACGDAVTAAWVATSGRALVQRLDQLARWMDGQSGMGASERVRVETAIAAVRRRAADVLADWGELLTDRARLEPLVGDGATAGDVDRLVSWVSAQLAEPEQAAVGPDGSPIESVDTAATGKDIGDEDNPAGRYDVEDDPILLRLVQLKRGGLVGEDGSRIQYEHIAVDEAQDRSAIEVKVLLEACAGDPGARSVTIAGDRAQRLVFDNFFESWDELLRATGHVASAVRLLGLSYRSTAEVMELAREILGPDLAPNQPLIARNGAPVEFFAFTDIGEAVAFLSDALRQLMSREPTGSVAVIARYPEQADAYHAGLRIAEVPSLRRVEREEFTFEPGIDVTDVAQVKGLEFDYVILVDVNAASYPDSVEARHLLHIAVTRAAHQLWMIGTSRPSPLIPAAMTGEGKE
jgi:DNA helicase-2/ATP-dependent DNA helicase PcrA